MRPPLLFLFIFFVATTDAQFKNDNVKYSTVYPEDLCKTLQANPGYVLLDVRSQGEFDDTSSMGGMNIGHIKGAQHISIQELPQRWKELLPYKEKPLFIYCSHSQRSRRASRMLSDSGFTKLFNIDGGLTNFYVQGIAQNPCPGYTIVSNVKYKIISPKQLAELSRSMKPYFILDVRSDSSSKGISKSAEANIFGRFNDAVNIPFDKLSSSLNSLPTDKPVIVVDEYGSESAKAAAILADKGWKDVSVLINGMDEWLDYAIETGGKSAVKWSQKIPYKLVSADGLDKMMGAKKDIVLIDTRSEDEFKNASKNYWENIGNIQGAVNVPAAGITNAAQLPSSKDKAIILYGFNNQDAIYVAAEELIKQGYTNVSVLRSGIWNLRWSSHNIKGKEGLNKWVVNVPEQNL